MLEPGWEGMTVSLSSRAWGDAGGQHVGGGSKPGQMDQDYNLVKIDHALHYLECAGSPGNLGPEKGAEAGWDRGGACAEGVAGAELVTWLAWPPCLQSLGSLSRQAGCRESGGGRQ